MSSAGSATRTGAAFPTAAKRDLGLVLWQIRYEQRAYWRNRVRGIFTFIFPLMFLVIFGSLDNGGHVHSRGGISFDTFFVPGILAYGIIGTTYVNLAISTAILRDEGVLKRLQATPLPRWAYIAARIGSTVLIMLAITVVTLALGAVAYGVHVRASTLPGLIATLILGTAAFTTLGIGITRVHQERRGRAGDHEPHGAAIDVHLERVVSDRHAPSLAEHDRQDFSDPAAG